MEKLPTISDKKPKIIHNLDLDTVPRGTVGRYLLNIVTDGMGMPVYLPIMIARGREDGHVVGLTAAVHGNEINGIPVIQRLFRELDAKKLKGTVVGLLITNVPSFLRKQRRFIDRTDLNHIMPGVSDGNVSEVYGYRIVNYVVRYFDYLIDLHTASSGRINSYYIRADLEDPVTREMALMQNAQIVVHKPPSDGTLRGAADELGIHSITLEVGNPQVFQKGIIRSGLTGIYNLLCFLDMLEGTIEQQTTQPVICDRSYWLYTDTGGILTVHPGVCEWVKKDQVIANMRNIFGDVVREYRAPEAGIVIGKSVDPVNQTGGRILHLGMPAG